MAHRGTPIQSNVMGFEEILGSGDMFMTPRNSLTSSNASRHQTPVLKTKTIIKESPKKSRLRTPKKATASICDKCGNCTSCEKRQLQDPVVYSPLRLQSPTQSEVEKSTDSETTSPFKPKFITDSQRKSSRQSKWETVKAITETIIKEKDMIIERQKLKRLQLEQQVRDLEERLRKTSLLQMSSGSVEESMTDLEKEEQAYQQMKSSAHLLSDNNTVAKVMMEKAQLERQLGESEHKIAELKCSLLTQKSDLQQQIDYYRKLLNLSQQQGQALEVKNDSMKTKGESACKELSRLKLYLADLPTKEECDELMNKLVQTEEELSSSKEHMEGLLDQRAHLQDDCNRLSEELGESNEQVVQLLSQVSLLQKELSIWEQKEMLRDTTSDDDIVRLKEQQLELHSDYEKYKQLSETLQSEIDNCSREHEVQLADLTRQLENAELLVRAAQEECTDKDTQIKSLSDSLQQAQIAKEELAGEIAANEETVKVAEGVVSSQTCKLEQKLIEEIVYSTSSLQCLVDMYENPHKLDLADMLATRPTPITISSPREYTDMLNQQSASLKSIGEKIEKLRQFVIDKYADDMASSGHVECTTQ